MHMGLHVKCLILCSTLPNLNLVEFLAKVDKIRVTLMRSKKTKLTQTDRQTNLKELMAF